MLNKQKKIGFGLIFIGLIIGLSNVNITGAVIGTSGVAGWLALLMFLSFISGGYLLLIGNRNLEGMILKGPEGMEPINLNVKDIENTRKDGIQNYTDFFMRDLIRKGEIPSSFKGREYEYAKKKLNDLSNPAICYNEQNSTEYIEHYKRTPSRDRVPIPGDEGNEVKSQINWAVDKYPLLKKITEDYSKDERIWKAARQKIYDLSVTGDLGKKGSSYKTVPGTGTKYIYLRQIGSGARIFLRSLEDNNYDLLAIIGAQQLKKDEDSVIKYIQEMHDEENKKAEENKKSKKS